MSKKRPMSSEKESYFKEEEYKYVIEFTNLLLIKRFDNNF